MYASKCKRAHALGSYLAQLLNEAEITVAAVLFFGKSLWYPKIGNMLYLEELLSETRIAVQIPPFCEPSQQAKRGNRFCLAQLLSGAKIAVHNGLRTIYSGDEAADLLRSNTQFRPVRKTIIVASDLHRSQVLSRCMCIRLHEPQ